MYPASPDKILIEASKINLYKICYSQYLCFGTRHRVLSRNFLIVPVWKTSRIF